ncbi:MAG: rRNA pseudouridine synthase [Acidimicrobiales bacterium]|nr:rRNA pseudouridine synthase [Acidimicrobiales bacterium]MBO0887146.1 rRNA pseudouridine synthase [Acidimicrobiales bacterium]MBO0894279.1 rRNA pseudouridine synthase [Acidimicrobiales bacterium]
MQKLLAGLGFGSRRACEELVTSGRVLVNGAPARLGQRVDPAGDKVEVDGRPVGIRPGLVHYLLNKPLGVISTAHDPQHRPRVIDLVPPEPRVFPVGRLDASSSGLLILTNDGELAHLLTHPSFEVEKEYVAVVRGSPSRGALRALRQGVELDDGRTAPAKVSVVGPGILRLVVREGRNRLVRRMCAEVGHPVRQLTRTRIGPVADQRLAPGHFRRLRKDEVLALTQAATARQGSGAASGRRGVTRARPGSRPPGPRRGRATPGSRR